MKFKGFRPEVTEHMLAKASLLPKVKFAWLPAKLHDGGWIWLEKYRYAPIGLWAEDVNNKSHMFYGSKEYPKEPKYSLHQFRVGGSPMDGEGGEYFPRRAFRMDDYSYRHVEFYGDNQQKELFETQKYKWLTGLAGIEYNGL